MKFEEKLQRIDEIVKSINAGSESLEVQIKLYEEGMKLIAECRDFLESAEKKIIDISKNVNGE